MDTVKSKAVVKISENARKRGFVARRNGSGHVNQKFASDLLARSREAQRANLGDKPEAAIPGVQRDDLARLLGQQVVKKAISGEDDSLEVQDAAVAQDEDGIRVDRAGIAAART